MAGSMKLFEHGDFANLVTAAARALERPEAFVEKDYYIAELLRIVASNYPHGEVVFKGGTSLSMAWGLIDRLSEDVDLLLAKDRFTPTLSRSRVDAQLAGMTEAIGAHPAFTAEHVRRERGFSRSDRFAYRQRFARAGIAGTIVSEPGVRGGATPSEAREISSDLGRFVREQGLGDIAEDTAPFSIAVLHFRRTFVEKLFIVHGLVHRLQVEGTPLGRDARHYIDLYELAGTEEVRQMIETSEYVEIAGDTNAIGVKYFGKHHRAPENLTFADSEGLFPPAQLRNLIVSDYDEQCATLCLGDYPSFDRVLARFEDLRSRL
jgi:hypothetical protein